MVQPLRVLVTGAARAIGLATVRTLADRGHSVIATARDMSTLDALSGVEAHLLDVTSEASIAGCLAEVGPLDAIVNNAAMAGGGPLEGYPLDRFRQMFETNALGALRLIQAVLPAWRVRGSGVIINVSSVNGQVSSPPGGRIQRLEVRAGSDHGVSSLRSRSLWHPQRDHSAGLHRPRDEAERAPCGAARLSGPLGAVDRNGCQDDRT
jgi:NAD(P)-dependent dehydrogenase (short-subunit alcohol dehydrogenase family)